MGLAQEVFSRMAFGTVKVAALVVLLLTATAAGLGWLTRPTAIGEGLARRPVRGQSPAVAKGLASPPAPAPGRMTIGGRVLDPQGKPLPNASVIVYGASKQGGDILKHSSSAPRVLGEANCDGSGQFRLDMPRISSATHYMVGAAALAPGFGVGWVELDVDATMPVAVITLRPEQVIEGRLFDITGQVAQGVRVSVEGIGHPARSGGLAGRRGRGTAFLGRKSRQAHARVAAAGNHRC